MKLASLMGGLEATTYRRLWRASARYRRSLQRCAAASVIEAETIDRDPRDSRPRTGTWRSLREVTERLESFNTSIGSAQSRGNRSPVSSPVSPVFAAASLLFARAFDLRRDLLEEIHGGAPTILIDVADSVMLSQVKNAWQEILLDDGARPVKSYEARKSRPPMNIRYLIIDEIPKASLKQSQEEAAFEALSSVRPLIAISPIAKRCLPDILTRAATARVDLPGLDAPTIARIIRIVTGRVCRDYISPDLAQRVQSADLVIAIRPDRTPAQCVAELERLTTEKQRMRDSRDLSLADLHGLGEARAWAHSAISDIKAWKEGRIPWSQLSSGIALVGPAGCGKTTFASVFCQEAGLHMVSASLAKWQSAGEAHLGHLLRAMRQDFEEARANAPSCIFIDEIDSFPERAGVTHRFRDYVVEVVNALLAEIDGIKGRDGVIVVGASNDIRRCEPALLRAGRLETLVSIGRPDTRELERMLRVRLRNDLQEEDLWSIAEAMVGMVGADVERVVKDARRLARQEDDRPIAMGDLREALRPNRDLSNEERWRFCVHEAAHLVAQVLHFGSAGVFANTVSVGSRGGMTLRASPVPSAGILEDYRKYLQVGLAGRTGEELLLGALSHAAGGAKGSDLEVATSLAASMVGSLGLVGDDHITYFGERGDTEKLLSFAEVRRAVARELAAAAAATKSLLAPRRAAIESIAKRLFDRGRISGEEAASILFDMHDPNFVPAASPVRRHYQSANL